MMGEVKILKAGMATSIQDFGRSGFGQYGVPRSGVMDRNAFFLANALLGNKTGCPVIEWTLMPPKMYFSKPTKIVCAGAIVVPKVNGMEQKMNQQIVIPEGAILSFNFVGKGVFGYIAIQGGFAMEKVMGSASMFSPITKKATLRLGDNLMYESTKSMSRQNAKIKFDNSYLEVKVLDVFPGPEFDLLTDNDTRFLLKNPFTISAIRSRMGVQLQEQMPTNLSGILTGPVLPGTVQLTPSGTLIVLMRDCQTTGGYPRILQLQEAAISQLAQKETGKPIVFRLIV